MTNVHKRRQNDECGCLTASDVIGLVIGLVAAWIGSAVLSWLF